MRRYDSRLPVILQGLSVSISKDDDRSFNRSLKIFNKKVQEDGVIKEVRDRLYYESRSEKKQRRKKMARKRWLKKQEQLDKIRY